MRLVNILTVLFVAITLVLPPRWCCALFSNGGQTLCVASSDAGCATVSLVLHNSNGNCLGSSGDCCRKCAPRGRTVLNGDSPSVELPGEPVDVCFCPGVRNLVVELQPRFDVADMVATPFPFPLGFARPTAKVEVPSIPLDLVPRECRLCRWLC